MRSTDFVLHPGFVDEKQSVKLLERLIAKVDWRRDTISLYGRSHKIPRLHQWYADPGLSYSWSGITMQPTHWFEELSSLREQAEAVASAPFNSVLVNYYRDGNDSMGWHSDDEPELGPAPVIASLSLGAPRDFKLRSRDPDSSETHTLNLESGSLLVMSGQSQRDWQHSLPKRKRVFKPRVNLTFRQLLV